MDLPDWVNDGRPHFAGKSLVKQSFFLMKVSADRAPLKEKVV